MIKICAVAALFAFMGCNADLPVEKYDNISEIERRYISLHHLAMSQNRLPGSEGEKLKMVSSSNWTSGFFPGCQYYLYQLTGDREWLNRYNQTLKLIEKEQYHTISHDVGFIISCSFGRPMDFDENLSVYNQQIIHNAAQSLVSRYNERTSCIISWDHPHFENPMIVDNLMNLDIIYKSLTLSPNREFEEVAKQHLKTSWKFLARADSTWFHIAEFYSETGELKRHRSGQAESLQSVWSRGQTWAIYGNIMAYQFFRSPEYLDRATNSCEKLLNYLNPDFTLNWDVGSSQEQIDISSSCILASALVDLYVLKGDSRYLHYALNIVENLKDNWLFDQSKFFMFGNSVGNFPKGLDVSSALIYADYYYLEALVKLKRINYKIL